MQGNSTSLTAYCFLLRLCFLAVGLGSLPGCGRQDAPAAAPIPQTAAVRLVQVKKGEATRSVTLPANVVAYQQATLYAKVAGYAKTVLVDKGDAVKEGALLADIEVPELVADLAKYKAELQVAEIDYHRVSEAQSKAPDLVIPQSVDTARSKYDVAKANLYRTETLLSFSKISAPFSGVITKRMVDPGAFIPAATSGSAAQNAALFTLMDFSKVRVQVPVPESEVPYIKNGLRAKVMVEELPQSNFEGKVTRFSNALEESTKTMLAEIELPNPENQLRPGMYARTRIIVETRPDTLVLPVDAILVEKTRNSVFTAVDNKAHRVTVKTGFNDGGVVEILEGAKPGDLVILVGKQVLVEGQPVTVTESK